MPEYHNSKGHKYYRRTNDVFIYNVPKSLIKQYGNDFSIGFKYPKSEDGFAHFTVSENELFDSKNQDFMHVIMPKGKKVYLTYKENGNKVSYEVKPVDIKAAFEAVRVSSKPSRKYQDNSREIDIVPEHTSDDFGFDYPFD